MCSPSLALAADRAAAALQQQQHPWFAASARGEPTFSRLFSGWALLQQQPEQQQPFAPHAMPRQNSLRCPFGQTHWQGEMPDNNVVSVVIQTRADQSALVKKSMALL
jgi:hypothetical protein